MIGINLSNNISCEYICKTIQQLVDKHKKENGHLTNIMLTISINNIVEGSLSSNTLNIENHLTT